MNQGADAQRTLPCPSRRHRPTLSRFPALQALDAPLRERLERESQLARMAAGEKAYLEGALALKSLAGHREA